MRLLASLKRALPVLLPLAVAVLGCGEGVVSPELGGLLGIWSPPTQQLQPQGTMEGLFIVRADGATEDHVIARGLYGQSANEVSLQSILYGHIGVNGNKFLISPDSLVTHDEFYGPTHREVQRDFRGWPRDSTTYEIHVNVLVLEFYTYPADAPILTRQTLMRVR